MSSIILIIGFWTLLFICNALLKVGEMVKLTRELPQGGFFSNSG